MVYTMGIGHCFHVFIDNGRSFLNETSIDKRKGSEELVMLALVLKFDKN